jgi:pimeloyl-ACP methyl ester carboxylesterase
MTQTVRSADGTEIAFETTGDGPPLVLVDGALCYRGSGPATPLAEALAPHFTVHTYDRRGRGESGNAPEYSPQREVEDLAALIKQAGGSAAVYGISSGAALALEAARSGLAITRLALYEAPFIVDDTREPAPADFLAQLRRMIAEDRRSDAVRLFLGPGVGVPAAGIAAMRLTPAWKGLKAVAHTLPYDMELLEGYQRGNPLPTDRWDSVAVPTLAAAGGKSPAWMQNAMRQLAERLPNAEYQTLPGQNHMIGAPALAPVLARFFGE